VVVPFSWKHKMAKIQYKKGNLVTFNIAGNTTSYYCESYKKEVYETEISIEITNIHNENILLTFSKVEYPFEIQFGSNINFDSHRCFPIGMTGRQDPKFYQILLKPKETKKMEKLHYYKNTNYSGEFYLIFKGIILNEKKQIISMGHNNKSFSTLYNFKQCTDSVISNTIILK
jgi:hypothetical protein